MAIDAGSLEFAADEALVVAFQDGEPDSFSRIVEAYYGVLIGRARRLMRCEEDAQDVVQETLLRAYRGLSSFGGEYRLAAWLNRILGNVAADAKRRQGLEIRLHTRLAGVRDVDAVPEELIADADADRTAVANAVACLSDLQREAFVLRTVRDQSYAEIAEILSISEVNARARVHRARTQLQESLRGMKAPAAFLVAWRGHFSRFFGRRFTKPALDKRAALSVPAPTSKGFGVAQIISQSMATPTGQAVSTMASEAGRWIAPGTGAFTGLLASAAVVVVAPASMLLAPLVAPSQAAPAPRVVVAAPAVTVADDQPLVVASTPATVPAPTPAAADTVGPKVATDPAPTPPVSSTATADPTTASGTASGADTTAPSTTTPSTSAPWWANGAAAAGGTGPPATGVALPACPYVSGAPTSAGAVGGGTSGGSATDYLSSETVAVPASTTSFDSSGLGTLSDGSAISSVNISFGACLPSTSNPALLATISSESTPGKLQLNGALVSSSAGDSETDSYYRGLAQWVDAADAGSPAVVFVADVVTMTNNTALLHVAFFGPVAGPLSPPPPPSAPATVVPVVVPPASPGTGSASSSTTPPVATDSDSSATTPPDSSSGSNSSTQSNVDTSSTTDSGSTPAGNSAVQQTSAPTTQASDASCTSTGSTASPPPQQNQGQVAQTGSADPNASSACATPVGAAQQPSDP